MIKLARVVRSMVTIDIEYVRIEIASGILKPSVSLLLRSSSVKPYPMNRPGGIDNKVIIAISPARMENTSGFVNPAIRNVPSSNPRSDKEIIDVL